MSVRVLIVEDEPLLLDLVAEAAQDEGLEVLRAMTAESALAVLESDVRVDVLFTDIRLPGAMNGIRLAEEARRLRSSLKIIYATGYSEEDPPTTRRDRFFMKPYSLSAVIQAMQADGCGARG